MKHLTPGSHLKKLRTELDKTQKELVEDFERVTSIAISVPRYSHYETDKRPLTPDLLNAFADYFKVTTDYIMGRTDNRKETSAASLVPDGFEFKSMDDILRILYLKLVSDGKLKAGDPLPEVAVRILMDKLAAGSEIVESFKDTGGKSTK